MGFISDTLAPTFGKLAARLNGANQFGVPSSVLYPQRFGLVAAKSATAIVSAGAADVTTTQTISVTVATARNFQAVLSGAGVEVLTVTGTDVWGQAQSESITLAGAVPVLGNVAFKTFTSWKVAPAAGGGTTINIGTHDKLGLNFRLTDVNDVVAEVVDGLLQNVTATGSLAGTFVAFSAAANADDRGTYLPHATNVPDAAKDFTVSYTVQEITTPYSA